MIHFTKVQQYSLLKIMRFKDDQKRDGVANSQKVFFPTGRHKFTVDSIFNMVTNWI
jgi:hypothetical protein